MPAEAQSISNRTPHSPYTPGLPERRPDQKKRPPNHTPIPSPIVRAVQQPSYPPAHMWGGFGATRMCPPRQKPDPRKNYSLVPNHSWWAGRRPTPAIKADRHPTKAIKADRPNPSLPRVPFPPLPVHACPRRHNHRRPVGSPSASVPVHQKMSWYKTLPLERRTKIKAGRTARVAASLPPSSDEDEAPTAGEEGVASTPHWVMRETWPPAGACQCRRRLINSASPWRRRGGRG